MGIIIGFFLACILFGITFLAMAGIRACVLILLWKWYIVPIFAVAPLSIPMALGLILVAAFINPPKKKLSEMQTEQRAPMTLDRAKDSFYDIIVFPCGTLLIGYLISLFVVVTPVKTVTHDAPDAPVKTSVNPFAEDTK